MNSKLSILLLLAVSAAILMTVSADDSSSSSSEENHEGCDPTCGRSLIMVCGKSETGSKTFGNECMWRYYNCVHKEKGYPEVAEGACPQDDDGLTIPE